MKKLDAFFTKICIKMNFHRVISFFFQFSVKKIDIVLFFMHELHIMTDVVFPVYSRKGRNYTQVRRGGIIL